DAGVIVDSDVQVCPALATELVEALPRDAMPEAANPAQLLGVDMEQIADGRVLVPLGEQRSGQPPAPREPTAPQHARHGGRTDLERSANLPAGPLLAPQYLA